MKPIKFSITVSLLVLATLLLSGCKKKDSRGTETVKLVAINDSDKIQIDLPKVNAIGIIFPTDKLNGEKYMNREDQFEFLELINTAIYDTTWNKNGIMIKMVAPDYTITINYKNKSFDENDRIVIWADNNKMKYQSLWYTLPEETKKDLINLFESYRDTDK